MNESIMWEQIYTFSAFTGCLGFIEHEQAELWLRNPYIILKKWESKDVPV